MYGKKLRFFTSICEAYFKYETSATMAIRYLTMSLMYSGAKVSLISKEIYFSADDARFISFQSIFSLMSALNLPSAEGRISTLRNAPSGFGRSSVSWCSVLMYWTVEHYWGRSDIYFDGVCGFVRR